MIYFVILISSLKTFVKILFEVYTETKFVRNIIYLYVILIFNNKKIILN